MGDCNGSSYVTYTHKMFYTCQGRFILEARSIRLWMRSLHTFHRTEARYMCTFIFNMSLSLAESTSEMGQGNYMSTDRSDNRTDMFYAVFRTPSNSIQGSAVCAFKLADIERTFMGKFKGQESTYHNWLPISHPNPDRNPHPSICVNDSYQISEPMLNFIKSHTLMDPAVPSAGGSPLIVLPTFK